MVIKVIADYPNSDWRLGEIIQTEIGEDGQPVAYVYDEIFTPNGEGNQGRKEFGLDFFNKYPHLFKIIDR